MKCCPRRSPSSRFTGLACVLLLLLLPPGCSDTAPGGGTSGVGGSTGGSESGPGGGSGSEGTTGTEGGADATGTIGSTGSTGSVDGSGPGPGEPEAPPTCDECLPPAACIEGYCVEPEPEGCEPGATGACLGETQLMTCDESGTAMVPVDCGSSYTCKEGECVPSLCQPGQVFCEGLAYTKACNSDGTGFEEPVACPESWYCTSGKCTDACFSDPKFGDYVGCSYWTVDLPNWPDPTILPTNPEDLPHALVLSNPNELDATLSFELPAGVVWEPETDTVPAGQSVVIMMPVLNTEGSGVSPKGIRFSSTRPILAHQFNPWKAIWSNDASLLLPESFLGSDYVVHSWPTDPRGLIDFPIPGLPAMENVNSFFTVVAPYEDTKVTIQVTGRVAAGTKISAMDPGGLETVTLDKGEVLNVEGEPANLFEMADLTGSTVSSDKPVAVFAGHESAGIAHPTLTGDDADGCCLDHLEEQMLPLHVLDTSYLAVKSKPRGNDPDLWRIVAADDNVTLTTEPPQPGVHGATLAKRGSWVEVYTEESFEITASGKIQVGQYFIGGSDTTSYTGDPSLMLAVPAQRFRDFYVMTVPPGYDTNWITVIRPTGVAISGSNGPIPEADFTPFASGLWEFAYVAVDAGVHKFAGNEPFGLIAYGYNGAMSYGYTGGID